MKVDRPSILPGPGAGVSKETPYRSAARDFLRCTAAAASIAVGAQIAFRLPFTDVPVTGQVFFVLLAGGLLGSRRGALSVIEYLAAGAAGVPVFAMGGAGPAALIGPTGGYFAGFVLAAALVGAAAEQRSRWALGAAMAAGLLAIDLLGGIWRHLAFGHPWPMVLGLAVLPFLAVDGLKAVAAWAVISRVRSR